MTTRSVKLDLTSVGSGTIEIDGQQLRGVRGLALTSEAGGESTLTLELLVHDISTFAEALTLIDDDTAATLVALGWTPPDEQTHGASGWPKAWRHSCGELNEGEQPVMCGACRFDVSKHPDDVTARYVLVELPSEEADDAAPE